MKAMSDITLEELKKALVNNEFIYYYQPKVSMITGKICGAEALIRWQKPDGKIIPPFEFIPLAESSGFINEITLAMFHKLIIDMAIIHDVGDSLIISFNASAIDFLNNKLIENIQHVIKSKIITPDMLEVELTETAILSENEYVKQQLNTLHNMGVGLAMDDFGTGYSSIDTLSKYHFNVIKIDHGIVGRMEHSEKDAIIVQTSIELVHELGLDIVAEGIETENCFQALLGSGCTIGQGYWFSRPIPLDQFIDLIKLDKTWTGALIGVTYQAQLDHIKWRQAIIDGLFYITSRKDMNTHLRGSPELDPTKCRLGKWFHGPGIKFINKKWYDELETHHISLHRIGAELLESARQGTPKNILMPKVRQLSEESIIIINILQEVGNELLITSSVHDPEPVK